MPSLSFRVLTCLSAFAAILLPGAAFAACTSPAAPAGKIFFNTTYKVMQYCNGTDWVNTGAVISGAAQTGCSSPTAGPGVVVYNKALGVVQFCNGSNWVDTACAAARTPGGNGCTSPTGKAGTIHYETSNNELQFCDSTNWVAMGWPCGPAAPAPGDTTPPAWQTSATLPAAKQDDGHNIQYYSQTLSATDANTVTYSLQSGSFPPGLSFNTSTGALTGYPTTYGGNTFTVRATDTSGNTADRTFTLNVTDGIAPVWVTTSPLAQATVNTPYSVTFQATDSVSSVTYPLSSPISPATPGGMSYNVGTHTFSGTPQSGYEGAFTITIDATDAAGNFTTRNFSITINPDPNE